MAYTTTLTRQRDNREERKQKIMVALIPILAIIFVLVISNAFQKSSPVKLKAEPSIPQSKATPNVANIQWTLPALYESNFPDPMRLTAPMFVNTINKTNKNMPGNITSSVSEQDLNIIGIIYADGSPAVLIGTEIYSEGDVIAGIKIVQILEDKVVVEKEGKQWEHTITIEQ